jgi:hypothetical protein
MALGGLLPLVLANQAGVALGQGVVLAVVRLGAEDVKSNGNFPKDECSDQMS